ncbi:hypothetical protein F7731_04025 [Cytobacillus depressus]|uniref:G5 domain-containing protein n=1 Tax=Cytobacillus depressus TaxID=1602942 RepID=A0A6L3VH01_9BACI|nr:VanW family protein [Cytobacillus depressus]KAB2338724.1 hypothetical protein F7731_04025 [Cytobacillus depressus]
MKNKQGVKLFIVLFLCTIFIFAFSHYGAFAYNTVVNHSDSFAENTMVGNVSIVGKTEAEAMEAVDDQLTRWLDEMVVNICYKEKQVHLDNALFRFNVPESVKTATNGQRNMMVVQFEENNLENAIQDSFPTVELGAIDMQKLTEDLFSGAKLLEIGNLEFSLDEYLTDSKMNEDVIVQQTKVETGEVNFSKMINELATFEIPAKSQVSLLQLFAEKGLSNVSSERLNMFATGIYELILPTNFSIIERNIGNEKPENVSLGFEAKVDSEKNIDLIFANPNETSYTIQIESIDHTLIFSLKGQSFLNKYVIVIEDEQSFKPKTIKQFNSLLKPREKVIERQGKEGLYIKVLRETYDETGALLHSEVISEDFYPPVYQIEVTGLVANVKEETVNEQVESADENPQPNNSGEIDDEEETLGEVIKSNSDLWGKTNEHMK